jgi:membrane associated rhomboid family serine protease
MNEAATHPAEVILTRCAEAAPQPWFPRAAIAAGELDPRRAADVLTELETHGLIQRAGGDPEKGPAITLTEDGRRLVADPEAMKRLREGHLPRTRIAEARKAIMRPGRPVVTYALIAVCVAWFLVGLVLASRPPTVIQPYLIGLGQKSARYLAIQETLGVAWGPLLLEGQWWRLLANGFVHFGLLHLLMNMWVLYDAGRYVEAMWGRGRYLALYFISLVGGSCLAMGYQPGAFTAGASGAICGVLAADAVWVLLNGKYLPEAMARRARTRVVFTAVIIIVISFLPFVSGWGHLGGALAGGAAALLFQFERSAPRQWGYAALLGLPLVPALSWYAFEHGRRTDPDWAKLVETQRKREKQEAHRARQERLDREAKEFTEKFLEGKSKTYITRAMRQAGKAYEEDVRPLLDRRPARRDPEAVKKALGELPGLRKEMETLVESLGEVGPYEHEIAEKARTTARAWAQAWVKLLGLAEQCLRAGDDWPLSDDAKIRKQEAEVLKHQKEWRKLVEPR